MTFDALDVWAADYPRLYVMIVLAALVVAAWMANLITRRLLLRIANRLLAATVLGRDPELGCNQVVTRLAHMVPALVLWAGAVTIPYLPDAVVVVVRNVSAAYIVLTVALALGDLLNTLNALYVRRPENADRPIKGYLQVLKIAIYAIATILIIAALIDRSPLILLSGLGAMAAVLMLVFQDTLLSLVASVQISSGDIVRVGDWIEVPHLQADGDVIDIALHTVRVQNWDKTITTFPTKRLISEPFKNWRGMQESGGRRIKRSLYLDQTSVRFLTADEERRLARFATLRPYLERKQRELEAWNAELTARGEDAVNARRVTNLGTFRAYVAGYLQQHSGIHQEMTLMVRQLDPGPTGLPLEVYCFSRTIAWTAYEGIQSDIFDHLLAILPEFGLGVFQQPNGADVRAVFGSLRSSEPAAAGDKLPG